MERTILVTGATGKLGGAVTDTLAARGYDVRATVRNFSRRVFPASIETIPFDYDDRTTYERALGDVDGIFLVAPPLDYDAPRRLAPFLAEARRTGRPHVVVVSSLDTSGNEGTPLRRVELKVRDSGLPWTILRPTFFMENFSEGFLAPSIRDERAIRLPAGSGKTSFVSVHDIAAVAAAAFAEKRYGDVLSLTGPEALDHREVARILGDVLGEAVTYVPLEEDAFLAGVRKAGLPGPSALYLAELYRAVREGHASLVTDDVERVAGRRPVTFREFAGRNAGLWRGGGAVVPRSA